MLRDQEEGWRDWFAEEDVKPIEISYPVLWRNLTEVVGNILEQLGLDPRTGTRTGAGAPGRSALRRMGRPLPGRRRKRGPTDMTATARDAPRRRTAAAGGRSGAHHPRGRRRAGAAVLLFSAGKDSIVLLRLAEKAFRPLAAAVSGDARRHRPQLRRGDRVPRPPGHRRGPQADRRVGAGVHRQRPGPRPGSRALPATGRRPARCSTRWRPAASTPRSAAPAATRNAPAPRNGS